MASRRNFDLRLDPEDRLPVAGKAAKPTERSGRGRAAPPKKPGGGWRRRLAWAALRWSLVLGIWGAVIFGGMIAYFALTLPETGDFKTAMRRPSVTLLAADGSLLATYGDLFGEPVKLREMSKYLPEAVIATEDRRFYSHFGLDLVGLLRAAFIDLRAGHVVQGGSTITQQLAKNLFLTPDRTWRRKIQEMLLALWLERKFTKDQLLEIYLNRVYLGAGTYGVDAAAHRYFDKSARQLTLYESAVIAGLLKAPTRFSPAQNRERAAGRAEQVLANMVDAGFIRQDEAEAAARQSTQLAAVTSNHAGSRYFADWIVEQLADFGGLENQDLTVKTTFDPRLQAAAEAAVTDTLKRDGAKFAVSQGALVAMSHDGAVRAIVGGRDYGGSQFNRATQALRQPGSSFKAFVYLAGLEAGLTPNDRMVDAPFTVGKWTPHNYTHRYLGPVTLAEAFAQSINTVAVQVEMRAGIPRVIAAAHRLGITEELANDASLALGTSEVSLIDLTAAYAAFANGGIGAWPYGIEEVRGRDGRILFQRNGSGPGRVIAPEIEAEMTQLMEGVLVGRGSGRAAALDRPAAGKTGTTSDYRDALFIGFTADLVAGVWFGNDDNQPMNKVTGGSLPAQTWHAFMMEAEKGLPPRPLPGSLLPAGPAVASAPASHLPSWFEALFGGASHAAPSLARNGPAAPPSAYAPPARETP
ncbi:MAG TPA: PBP1A family penicillin-binding protein [Stellaceae bacterium]|nr:PBP1A family penicillin-binding protein [Stellaceae bacterium]